MELSNKKFNQSNLVGVLKFSGTRWSGAFMALSRLFRLKDHIKKYFSEHDDDSEVKLTNAEWKLIPQFLVLFEPLNLITKKLQVKHASTSSYKYFYVNFLHDIFTEALEGNVMEVDVENIEINVKLTCPLVKDAAKRFVKSLKKEFQEFLFPKLPAVEKKDVLLMFCDPRLKKWILSFRNGSLMNGVTRNVKLNLEKIFQKPNELETEPEDDDVTEIEQPDPKKARLARKFKFGNIETVKNVESTSDTIEEIFTILMKIQC